MQQRGGTQLELLGVTDFAGICQTEFHVIDQPTAQGHHSAQPDHGVLSVSVRTMLYVSQMVCKFGRIGSVKKRTINSEKP